MSSTVAPDKRSNWEYDIAALVAASASGNSADIDNPLGNGIRLTLNIGAITGSGASIVVTLQGKDPTSGQYYTILASAAKTATGVTALTVFPAAPATANVSANDFLPRTFRVSWTIAGTTPAITATIGASVVKA